MATLGKTLPQSVTLPARSLAPRVSSLKFGEEVVLALDTLRKNPLRSALTILGIVIGITTVIAVSAMINGLNDNVLAGIRELGSDTIICYRFPWASLSRPPSDWYNRKELQPEWAEDIEKLPHVSAASPSMRIFNAAVRRGHGGPAARPISREERHPAGKLPFDLPQLRHEAAIRPAFR
jgi:hypothetical protein